MLLAVTTTPSQIALRERDDVWQVCQSHFGACHAQCYATNACTPSEICSLSSSQIDSYVTHQINMGMSKLSACRHSGGLDALVQ